MGALLAGLGSSLGMTGAGGIMGGIGSMLGNMITGQGGQMQPAQAPQVAQPMGGQVVGSTGTATQATGGAPNAYGASATAPISPMLNQSPNAYLLQQYA